MKDMKDMKGMKGMKIMKKMRVGGSARWCWAASAGIANIRESSSQGQAASRLAAGLPHVAPHLPAATGSRPLAVVRCFSQTWNCAM